MKTTFFVCLVLAVTSLGGQELMPLDNIKPGMKGYGMTVFNGFTPEEFPITVVEIWKNFQPKRNLILVHLEGEKARHTGVASGMSGSPVYIDGKLIGALSYSIGAFMKDPLAGVTPIHEMIEIFDREAERDLELARYTPRENRFLEMAIGLQEANWENFITSSLLENRNHVQGQIHQLPLPLSFSGIQPELVETAGSLLNSAGFMAVHGGSGSADPTVSAGDFVPGSAVGAVLVSGDAGIEAIGTVTYRDADRFLAFGHPFFNTGPVDMPISIAKILTIAPSELSAFKLGSSSLLVGSLKQDRQTGIFGLVGEIPEMIPLKVVYVDEAGQEEKFDFKFTDERSINTLTPLFLRFVLVNALQSARLATGENSLMLSGTIHLSTGEKIDMENFYPGMRPLSGIGLINGILQSTGEIAATLGAVLTNDFRPAAISKVELHFKSMPGRRTATIEQAWIDRAIAAKGDSARVYVRLKTYRGPEIIASQKLEIPANAEGRILSLIVSGRRELLISERRAFPGKFVVQDFEQLLALLNERRRNDEIYFQLRARDRGLIIEGEELSSLPPTAYAVLQARNAKGNASRTGQKTLWEAKQRVSLGDEKVHGGSAHPFAVTGSKTIRIKTK